VITTSPLLALKPAESACDLPKFFKKRIPLIF
jgi:hypothetical protein